MEHQWYLYVLRCGDGSLYTGITTDVDRRLEEHRSGRGAKYTRGRSPLTLVYRERCESHSHALRREREMKALPRQKKELFVTENSEKILDKTVSQCYTEGELAEAN